MIKLVLGLALSGVVFAKGSSISTFACTVVGMDEKTAKLSCDPKDAKKVMTTPKEWIQGKEKVQMNKVVKFSLDDAHMTQWLAMNKMQPLPEEKKKEQK